MEIKNPNWFFKAIRRTAEITLPIFLLGDLAGLTFWKRVLGPAVVGTAVDAALTKFIAKTPAARAV
jgi:hypothetical protein